MGTSTDAILFYGYCWDEEARSPWEIGKDEPSDDDEYWEDRYAQASGLNGPAEPSLCTVGHHCSGDAPMPYVAIRSSEIRSWRGHMNDVKSLAVDPKWDATLAEFCRVLDIDVSDMKPAWWLVSNWS